MKRRKSKDILTILICFVLLLVMPGACEIVVTNNTLSIQFPGYMSNSKDQNEQISKENNLTDYILVDEPNEYEEDEIQDEVIFEPDYDNEYYDNYDETENIYSPTILPEFRPHFTENTNPDLMLESHAINADGAIVDNFTFLPGTDLGFPKDYAQIEGITTFRGNNFRNSGSFGLANIVDASFGETWTRNTASLTAPNGTVWTGHGWTGQPLIVRWPKETREIMNMFDWAKEQEDLVEVIYPAMDGQIYFTELTTGRETRKNYNIGFTFKGSGAIDPRGYPLLYVGAGYESAHGGGRIFIISLIDGSILHTFGAGDGFALRGWHLADGAPLIDSENDRLFFPSENGLIYILDLNTDFNTQEGTISVDPTMVRWRFRGHRSHVNAQFWLGIESSPAIFRDHMFLADNGGHFICLNLNTLEPVWVKDVLDDTNTSPVISIENNHPFIYMSTGFRAGWRASASSSAPIPVWKIDALTGEYVWRTDFNAFTVSNLSGGVQGTIAIGEKDLEHLIFVPIARSPNIAGGTLAALSKETGEVVWEYSTSTYSWSSPVIVYNENGRGFIVYTTSNADIHLLDGLTGELLDRKNLGRLIESSPAVFENTIVIGTRCQRIWGIELT